MELPPLLDLSVFMALILVLSLFGLTVSGHFPAEFRAPALKTVLGKGVLWASIAMAAVAMIAALAFAWQRLPLYAAVLGGGGMLLIAPMLLQPLPDSFVNGRRGLLVFALVACALGALAAHRIA